MTLVSVTGPLAHDILIEVGGVDSVGQRTAALGCRRALVACDRAVADTASERAEASLAAAGVTTARVELIADERRKSIDAVAHVWSAALTAGLSRRDAIVAVGGGLVSDVAGFAAASFLRGIRVVQVPTTVLAMVDASTGGKTGINLPLPDGGLGKNLAGAFWPPAFVIADPLTLSTLGDREFRAGLAECIKHGVIDGDAHLSVFESSLPRVLGRDPDAIAELVAGSVAVKAAIVSRDPREEGERALLNLGHTFAHALETLEGHDLLHGEAVGLGLIAACALGSALSLTPRSLELRVHGLVASAGLPTRVAGTPSAARIRERMGFDKKADAGAPRFVVPTGPGAVRYGVVAPESAVRSALVAIGVDG